MSRALIIVDVQRDFLPDGALPVPDGDAVIGPINALAADGAFDVVLATRDWHPPDHASFETQGGPWPVHCVQGTPGAELAPGLDVGRIDVLVDTGQTRDAEGYSGFESDELRGLLRTERIAGLCVVGLATDVCVGATARDGLREGFAVTLDAAAMRGIDPGDTRTTLDGLREAGAVIH